MGYATGIEKFVDRCNRAMPPNFYTLSREEQRSLYLGLTKEFPYELPNDYQQIRYWESQLEFSDKELSKTDEVRTEFA